MLYFIVRWRLLSQSLGLGCLISLLLQLTAAAVELRVAVLDRVRQVTISSSTPAQLRDEAGRVLTVAPQQNITAALTGAGVQAGVCGGGKFSSNLETMASCGWAIAGIAGGCNW